MRIGFLINPIAGLGGRVGLKGTDGVVARALRRGAEPIAQERALLTLRELQRRSQTMNAPPEIHWSTCSGSMGATALDEAGLAPVDICYQAPEDDLEATSTADTRAAVARFLEAGVELILFCGGDGTARDIVAVTGSDIPLLGIPSGVKMFSGVFGVDPQRTAEIALGFAAGALETAEVEVLDLDEERYRRGEWAVRLYAAARTPFEPTLTQTAKALIETSGDAEVLAEIAEYLAEQIGRQTQRLVLLGAGGTVAALGERLGIEPSRLGIDALHDGGLVARDLDEGAILELLDRWPQCTLVLSPIGAQGFVLGRGNQQLSARVVRRIGIDNMLLVATPAKLARTPELHFDTGDADLDAELRTRAFLPVVVGPGVRRLVRVAP